MRAPDYKNPACESGKGNVSADIMRYTFTDNETVDDVITLRRMSEHNTYLRITAIADAAFTALTEIDLGYVSLDADEADDPVAFKDGLVLTNTFTELLVDINKIDFKHEIAMTMKVVPGTCVGKEVRFIVEFVNTAG